MLKALFAVQPGPALGEGRACRDAHAGTPVRTDKSESNLSHRIPVFISDDSNTPPPPLPISLSLSLASSFLSLSVSVALTFCSGSTIVGLHFKEAALQLRKRDLAGMSV